MVISHGWVFERIPSCQKGGSRKLGWTKKPKNGSDVEWVDTQWMKKIWPTSLANCYVQWPSAINIMEIIRSSWSPISGPFDLMGFRIGFWGLISLTVSPQQPDQNAIAAHVRQFTRLVWFSDLRKAWAWSSTSDISWSDWVWLVLIKSL